MKRLYEYVKKRNKEWTGWILIWLTALLIAPLCGFRGGESTQLFYLCSVCALFFFAVMDYLDKYLEIAGGNGKGQSGALFRAAHTGRFAGIMRMHAFDSREYFRILLLHFLPMQLLALVYPVVLCAVGWLEIKTGICLMAAAAMIPLLTIAIRGAMFRYALMHENREMAPLKGILRYVYDLLRFVAYEIVLLSLMLLAFALSGRQYMKGIDESTVASVSVDGGIAFLLGIIGAIAFGYWVIDSGAGRLDRFRQFLPAAALLAVVAGLGIYVFQCTHNSIVLYEDGFTVKRGGVETQYSLSDVESYRVYAANKDSFQMELRFTDGFEEELFRDSGETTDAWEEKYFSDYNYAAQLCESLSELGVKGTLEDKEVLLSLVNTSLDARCAQGFDRIVELTAP